MHKIRSTILFLSILTVPAFLAGCGGKSSIFDDNDGDGYSATEGDCDDTNPDIGPDAEEIWYDGFDQNCDNADDFDADGDGDIGGPNGVDCDDTNAALNSYDEDGDGFSTCEDDCDDTEPAASPGAAPLESDGGCYLDLDDDGYGSNIESELFDMGTDCNDSETGLNPGAEEIWYNDVDENCDGNDTDQDGDGDSHEDHGGGDCNDQDDSISSQLEEVGGNGIDENCDGRVYNNASGSQTFNNESQLEIFCSSFDSVQGSITIVNSNIANLDLSCLAGVTGAISIEYNTYLEHVDLSGLSTIQSNLMIYGNNDLEQVDLSGATEIVGGSTSIGWSEDMNSINLSSLHKIINAQLSIQSIGTTVSEPWSLDLKALNLIEYGTLNIANNEYLDSIDLSGLSAVSPGTLSISNNNHLYEIDFSTLNSIESGSYVEIIQLNSLLGVYLPALSIIDGYFSLAYNNSATEYNFPMLESITNGYLYMQSAVLLESFDLSSLTMLDGAQLAFNYTGLSSISLPSLTSLNSGAVVTVRLNDYIETVSFPALTLVNDGSGIEIEYNNSLQLIDMDSGPDIIDSYIEITNNEVLYDIYSLYNLSSASGSTLRAYYNYQLCNSVLDYLAYKSGLDWYSVEYISYNNTEC